MGQKLYKRLLKIMINTARINPWWIVFAAATVLAFSMGVRLATGLLVPNISLSLSASVADVSFSFAIQNLIWGAVSPLAGILAERYGTARVLLVGTFLYSLGLAVAAIAETSSLFFVGNALLIGLGIGATTYPLVLAAVGKRFSTGKRTLALGIASAGGSLGQFLYALVLGSYAPENGWQNTFLLFAASAVLVLLVIFLLKDTKPSKDSAEVVGQTVRPAFSWRTIGDALKVREYQLLNIGFFVCGFHIAFFTVHLTGFVTYCGFLPRLAADSLALIGFMNIFGVIFIGWAGDKWHKPRLLTLIYGVRGMLILLLLLLPKTESLIYGFSAIMGVLWLSTVPLTSGAVAQLFGTKNLASLFGVVMFSHQIGAFFGSWLGGLTYEWSGNYDMAIIISAGLALVAALVHLPMTPERMQLRAGAQES